MRPKVGNIIWIKTVYDGTATSDITTSDGTFGTPIDIDANCQHVLFLVHGVKHCYDSSTGDDTDATIAWKVYGQNTYALSASADYSDYAYLAGATNGVLGFTASDVVLGPYGIDVAAAKLLGSKGSLMMNFYSNGTSTHIEVHAVAIGYGGDTRNQDSSALVKV
jgi:hypothetical protein